MPPARDTESLGPLPVPPARDTESLGPLPVQRLAAASPALAQDAAACSPGLGDKEVRTPDGRRSRSSSSSHHDCNTEVGRLWPASSPPSLMGGGSEGRSHLLSTIERSRAACSDIEKRLQSLEPPSQGTSAPSPAALSDPFPAIRASQLDSLQQEVINLRAMLYQVIPPTAKRSANRASRSRPPSPPLASAAASEAPSPGTPASALALCRTLPMQTAPLEDAAEEAALAAEWEDLMTRTTALQGHMQRFALKLATAPSTSNDYARTRALGRRVLRVSPVPGDLFMSPL